MPTDLLEASQIRPNVQEQAPNKNTTLDRDVHEFWGKVSTVIGSSEELRQLAERNSPQANLQKRIGIALNHPPLHRDLARLIGSYYHKDLFNQRFLNDPYQPNRVLFVDNDGEIVALNNPEIGKVQEGLPGEGSRYIKTFDSYEVLTGSNHGKTVPSSEARLSPPPEPK